MAQSVPVQVIGAITAQPSTASIYSCTLQAALPLNACINCQSVKSNDLSGIASTDIAPFPIPFESITKARVFAMRLVGGATMKLVMTFSSGVFSIPVSDLFSWVSPNPGDECLSIVLVGSGDVSYLIGGDIT